jgi:Pyruvate/2-oxoglutarate dehydrogenase complex, dihydrolipoamide acyltransferase (E2) component, and related enzymes
MSLINILISAIDCSNRIIDAFSTKEKEKENTTTLEPNYSYFDDAIEKSTYQLKSLIEEASNKIINKIEMDKMEEFLSRTKNIQRLLKLKHNEELLRYSLFFSESIDYAENRFNEGKMEWVAPYLIGKCIFLKTIELTSSIDSEMLHEIRKIQQKIRHEILNVLVRDLIRENKDVPWKEIELILAGGGFDSISINSPLLEIINKQKNQRSNKPIYIPDIGGETVAVTEILINIGSYIDKDQSIITVEGDKSSIEVPSPTKGKITELKVTLGDKVSKGTLIAYIEVTD